MPITSVDTFGTGKPWPPEGELKRLQRYRDNRLLFWGQHDAVFEEAHRALRPELKIAQHFVLNLHKRLSTHWVDLVVGKNPTYTVETNQEALDTLTDAVGLTRVARKAVLDCSRFGNGLFKVWLEDGKAQIDVQQPDYWFPIVSETNVARITAHVLAWRVKRTTGGGITRREREYLRVEIHQKGSITHKAFLLGTDKIGTQVDGAALLGLFPDLAGRVDANGVEDTGIEALLLEQFAGLETSDGIFGPDDYSDLDSLIIEMEARLAQMSRILDKHADPGMYGPGSALEFDHLTQRWRFKVEGYLSVDKDEATPGYLTWDGDLTSALAEFNALLEQVILYAETSAAGLGLPSRSGQISSGFQFKLAMKPDLDKAARIRGGLEHTLIQTVMIAAELAGIDLKDISINWEEPLEDDPMGIAQIIQWLLPVGGMSRYTAVEKQHPDWSEKDILAELDRIAEDEASAAASLPGVATPVDLLGDVEGMQDVANA